MSFQPLTLDLDKLNDLSRLVNEKKGLDQIGDFVKEGKWIRLICKISRNEQFRIAHIVQVVNHAFAQLEQKSVKLYNDQINDAAYIEEKKRYRSRFTSYVNCYNNFDEWLKSLKITSSALNKEYHALKCNFIGMQYNIGAANGGLDPLDELDPDLFNDLKKRALIWKKNQGLSVTSDKLLALEIAQLKEAAKYKDWLPLLSNEDYEKEFFKWVLRDWNPVNVFILCRNTQLLMDKANLSPTLGRYRKVSKEELKGNSRLKIKKEILAFQEVEVNSNLRKRTLTLPIYEGSFGVFEPKKQRRINILNPNHLVTFKGDSYEYSLRVGEIWKESSEKNIREVRINFCPYGLIDYHPVYGPWDERTRQYIKIDMTKENWHQLVPPSDISTDEEVAKMKERYGIDREAKKIFKVMSNRSKPTLKALECHGFWRVYVPMGNKGKWKVIDVSPYAYRFHKNWRDALKLLCASIPRVISTLDQAGNLPRQKGGYAVKQTEKEAQQQCDRIYHYMTKEDGVFQITGKNCSRPIQRDAERIFGKDNIPNFFRQNIVNSLTGYALLDAYLAFLSRFPSLQNKGIQLACKFFELFAETKIKEVKKQEKTVSYSASKYFQETKDLYNPALLLHTILESQKRGEGPLVKGEVYWSIPEEKMFFKDNVLEEEELAL